MAVGSRRDVTMGSSAPAEAAAEPVAAYCGDAQRRVLEHVQDPGTTTGEQAAAVKCDGDFFLSACPGAGKTHTVGLRLAYHAAFHPDVSIAAVSHTNTAIHAIQAAARQLTFLPDHYWIDTLHAFLLRYVVYPFGHLYMRCSEVPRIIGERRDWPEDIPDVAAHGDYPGCRAKAWMFTVHPGPRLTFQRPRDWPPALSEDVIVGNLSEWAKETKQAYWRQGVLSFSDVLWVACQVLERHPEVAQAVAARFDELIVDEVQDAGELQLECIRLLRAQRTHPSLVIVGDISQAVFEWSGATPGRLRRFASSEGLREMSLTANFRSSKRICAVTHRFSSRAVPDRAAGAFAHAAEPPELWCWERRGEDELVERFRSRLRDLDIREDESAVLAWTNALVDRLNGRRRSDGSLGSWLLRALGAAAVQRDDQTGLTAATLRDLDRAVAYIGFGAARPANLAPEQQEDIRTASAQLLQELPTVQGDLRDWNAAARDVLDVAAENAARGNPKLKVRRTMRDAAALAGLDARETLAPFGEALARTVHDAKGESLAAVLVVARPEDALLWAENAWTEKPPSETNEPTRVAYVAFTRAKRLLVLAIPSDTAETAGPKFRAVGFTEVPEDPPPPRGGDTKAEALRL